MNLTALAVARSARRRGLQPWVFDVWPGPATHSRAARCVLERTRSRRSLLDEIVTRHGGSDAWLVSTADAWSHELVANRPSVDGAFARTLHPPNDALLTCLSKTRFAAWCDAHGVPAPRHYRFDSDTSISTQGIRFPVFVRPDQTQHGDRHREIPKACAVASEVELLACLETFKSARVTAAISESLLDRELQQISVGVAIDGDRTMTMVARKVRPFAQACRVGSLVETIDDDESEAVALDTMRALGYQGIGEVEILKDVAAGRCYVIEINARPWIQFPLAEAAGRDLLGLFLTAGRDVPRQRQRKRTWLDFSTDVWNCFNRSDGLVRRGQVSLAEYTRSLWRADVYARWSANDPAPFVVDCLALTGAVLRSLHRSLASNS
jgi:D-aspartate ligase